MLTKVLAKRISAATTFKILFVGFVVFHVASSMVVAVLVLLDVLPLEPPTEPLPFNPLLAVFAYLVVGFLLSPMWVGVAWLSIWPGIWLYSLLRPMKLEYVPSDDQSAPRACH